MGDVVEILIRAAIIIGIALFMWSVSASMEQIAKALTRPRRLDGREADG